MVQSVAGFQGTVTEVQEAQRFAAAVAHGIVDTPAAFKCTALGSRTIQTAAGSMLCNGVLFIESSPQSIQLPANTASGVRLDIVGLRFTWNGESSTVELFSKQGTAGSSTRPTLVRNPGSVYEFPLAVIRVRQNVSTIANADILDVRVWGGMGGRYQAAQTDNIAVVDLPFTAELQIGAVVYSVTANDGAGNSTLSLISAVSVPWTAYDPVLKTALDGTCNLGAGGVRRGFYQVVNGTCHVKFEIRKGTGTVNFGRGQLLVDLPAGIRPSAAFTDQWGDGLLNTNVGDGFYNWQVKFIIRNDQNNFVALGAPTNAADIRILPMQAAGTDGSAAGAIPQVRTGPGGPIVFLDPNVITGSCSYIVA